MPSLPILAFEALIIFGSFALLSFLSKIKDQIILRYLIVAVGVMTFEIFTAPMWDNFNLGFWAYVYRDVSWIYTLGWSSLILSAVLLVDNYFPKLLEWKRFFLYIVLVAIVGLFVESIGLYLGIRGYSPEVLEVVNGRFIPILNIPIHGLYYIPVFMTLVITFYKYWSFLIDPKPIVPVLRRAWLRSLAIALIGVFLFELMIEPMVINARFPSWSYIYRDISILMTGLWIIIIWLATNFVNKLFIHLDLTKKFVIFLLVGTLLFLPIESWFIINGFRIYGPSATNNFVGINTPVTNVPIEVALAVPLYLALIISFIRYWEISLDNKD